MASMMEDLIPLVNKLQDVFNTIGNDTLDLPQIVVVGSQSSGKSSVLENLVGKDFLPRGNGIVTRRPLVLQLVNLRQNADPDLTERAQFLHSPGKVFTDFFEVRKEIEEDTARDAGENKGISRNPIHLKIFSPHVLNLTVVDLPGLTKIPIGDQPSDIEKQIRSLILDYISKPNSIILAVSPANVDLVNSESLKLAKEVDPEGKRTIGVITKIDLMDAGTNALDILTGRVLNLKLGFIGVVNRSQQDTVANKPIIDSLKAETDFFSTHPAYKSISTRCGTAHLAKTLNQVLVNHIRERLPDMKSKLNTMIGQTQQELASYGNPSVESNENKGLMVLRLLTDFARNYTNSIDGTNPYNAHELCGGARIYDIFNHVYGSALKSINPGANLTFQDIRIAIRNSTGPRPSLFVPEIAFEILIKPQIKLLHNPSSRCVELVYEELMKICHSCYNKELLKFPKLNARINEVVSELLRERLTPTVNYVESLIDIQLSYINTLHPDFIGANGAMENIASSMNKKANEVNAMEESNQTPHLITNTRTEAISKSIAIPKSHTLPRRANVTKEADLLENFFGGEKDPNHGEIDKLSAQLDDQTLADEHEDNEIQLIRELIKSYFHITSKSIQDLVPKAIMHLLVNYTKDTLQNQLVSHLYKFEQFDELLMEDETLADERAKCLELLNLYKRAYEIINEAT
ncbi:hypothetical protein K502DRAFT_318837 [Neoconidiobolus thromboides FSU 785]|nr:hypothetical protein K502DRAFT_318837 [Neoconidiobolus thromboides FSU 785]